MASTEVPMVSKILTAVILLTFFGCKGKEYKKSENENIGIVSELNQGDADSVINQLSYKEDATPRERYYLASAYSKKGGVDVYSLYSILEMQLFRKNALEWKDLSKEKNPYLKFMKSQDGIDYAKREKKREERWNEYRPKLVEKFEVNDKKPTYEEIKEQFTWQEISEDDYKEADAYFKENFDKILKGSGDHQDKLNSWADVYMQSGDKNQKISYFYELANYYGGQLNLEIMKDNYLHPDKNTTSAFANVRWEMVYMNILWNTYEAIPIMKQMPALSDEQQEIITRSLNEYKTLLKDKEFKEVAIKNIGVLIGTSILSVYKESFDLDEVDSIQDLMCSFDPTAITDNYDMIRERILFLTDTYKDVEQTQDLKKFESKIDEFKASLPEHLTQEEKDNYAKQVEDFKLNTCFNG